MHRLYIISGCNGSGKTTASYSILPGILKCSQFVNSDEFANSLSPFDPTAASVQASRMMLLKIRYCISKRLDFAIETTLATRTLKRLLAACQALDYSVTVLYFWLNSPELAVKRVAARVASGGHNIDEQTIRRRYIVGLQYFFEEYAPQADTWILADNSSIPFKVVAKGGAGGAFFYEPEEYARILNLARFTKPETDYVAPRKIIFRPRVPPPTDKTL